MQKRELHEFVAASGATSIGPTGPPQVVGDRLGFQVSGSSCAAVAVSIASYSSYLGPLT